MAEPQNPLGKGMLFVYILGAVAIIGFVGATIYLLTHIVPLMSNRSAAVFNMRELSRATSIYAFDSDERLPLKDAWMDELTPFLPLKSEAFHSPGLADQTQDPTKYGIEMNAAVSGQSYEIAGNQPLAPIYFEGSVETYNASGPFPQDGMARYKDNNQFVIPCATFDLGYGFYNTETKQFKWIHEEPGSKEFMDQSINIW